MQYSSINICSENFPVSTCVGNLGVLLDTKMKMTDSSSCPAHNSRLLWKSKGNCIFAYALRTRSVRLLRLQGEGEGGGVKHWQHFAYVLYGWPPTTSC